jgi:hypothetical protein
MAKRTMGEVVRWLTLQCAAQKGRIALRQYVLWFLAVFPLVYAAADQTIVTGRKRVLVDDDGTFAVIEGMWRSTTGRPSIDMPAVNSVRIECEKSRRVCTEHVAKFLQPSDDLQGRVGQPHLFLMKETFRVLEWSPTRIIARAEPRAADIDLRISVADQSVERTSRETAARGATGADPSNIQQWRLVDGLFP